MAALIYLGCLQLRTMEGAFNFGPPCKSGYSKKNKSHTTKGHIKTNAQKWRGAEKKNPGSSMAPKTQEATRRAMGAPCFGSYRLLLSTPPLALLDVDSICFPCRSHSICSLCSLSLSGKPKSAWVLRNYFYEACKFNRSWGGRKRTRVGIIRAKIGRIYEGNFLKREGRRSSGNVEKM